MNKYLTIILFLFKWAKVLYDKYQKHKNDTFRNDVANDPSGMLIRQLNPSGATKENNNSNTNKSSETK